MALLTPSNLKFAKLNLNGLDEYLKKVESVGKKAEDVVKEAIQEASKPVYEDIKSWAEKHKLSGETLEGVTIQAVKQDGNYIFCEVGIDSKKSKNAWHAVFVEYGTPTNAPDPGIRRAFEKNKTKLKNIITKILEKGGIPVD